MNLNYKNSAFTLIILLMRCCYSYEACPSLISNKTLTVTCKHNNKTLDNCDNPMEGTEVYLTCNMFYEEATLQANPNRLCRDGSWDGPIPQCYPICGEKRSKENFTTEIAGQDIVHLDYPWHVGIYQADNKKFRCGGTLIAMNMVLTTAHCVTLNETLLVASGKYYIEYDDNRDISAQYSQIHEVHYPENYKGQQSAYAYNIAILVLTDSFLPSQAVQPICLNFDSISYGNNWLLADSGIVLGWGFTYQNMQITDVLKVVTVLYVSYSQCSSRIGINYAELYTFDKICGDYLDIANGNIICNDDDIGGGLALKNKINNRYYITGILVWCPNTNFLKYSIAQYSVYTAIFQQENFLENHTANIEMKNCLLPNHPSHGEYVFLNTSGTFTYEFDYPVPPHSRLNLTCNIGYNFTFPGATQFYCSKYGQWNPALTGCTQNTPDQSTLDNSTTFNYYYVILIVSAVVILVALVAIILYKLKYKQEWELRREIKLAGLYHFRNGNLKRFNPALGIGDQAELLPYNNNFEFPQDKLKLGKQLGSGAFGIVMQADAFGIIANEEKTTVAVKMIKNVADHIHLKALISELKIMVHLGQHLNVVNLLGACTQNITNRELLVIVEYCQFGNVYNYLLQNRKNYINQIDSATGNIDYALGIEDLTNFLAVPDNSSDTNSEHNALESITAIYTKDLISWAFQVARGMEYLASRKILHGDLAARNILLAENNIVKICDFGLAKRLYQSVNYKKQQDTPLPIKWMAIESIQDQIFSTQSDVWSFGIVLWEFFSLSKTPYPGMEADERLYYKLLDGYKMDSPPYAPKEMYNIMCDCWSLDPESRPSFNELAGRVGLMLEENVRQHYIDLNDPYLVINTQKLKNNHDEDYLLTLSPSGSQQISIPHSYINTAVTKTDHPHRTSENIYTTRPISLTINTILNIPNNENVQSLQNNEYLMVA